MTELERLNAELNRLPESQRESLAALLCSKLEQYTQDPLANLTPAQQAHLQKLIQEGLDSGPGQPWDKERFLAGVKQKFQNQLSS